MEPRSIQYTATFLDLSPYLNGNVGLPNDPVSGLPLIQAVLPLLPGEVWRARVRPVEVDKPDTLLNWSVVRSGQLVRVPVLPYLVSREMKFALLGITDVAQRCVLAWPDIKRSHIVLGEQVQDLSDQGQDKYRVWMGFAVRIE